MVKRLDAHKRSFGHHVDSLWTVVSGSSSETRNPATGETLATVANDVDGVVKTSQYEIETALRCMMEVRMKRKSIPVSKAFSEWRKDPYYVEAYDALEEEFALASSLIRARSEADMTQEQVAKALGTTQAVVARLESGRVRPSTRTLERFAKLMQTRLCISFERRSKAVR